MVFFLLIRLIPCSCTHASLNNGCAQCIDLDICCLTHGCLPLKRHTFVSTKKNKNRQKKTKFKERSPPYAHTCMHAYLGIGYSNDALKLYTYTLKFGGRNFIVAKCLLHQLVVYLLSSYER